MKLSKERLLTIIKEEVDVSLREDKGESYINIIRDPELGFLYTIHNVPGQGHASITLNKAQAMAVSKNLLDALAETSPIKGK